MGSFEPKQSVHLSLNKEARENIREMRDHLEENYNGLAHFVREKLDEENSLSVDEKIQRLESEMSEKEERLERLKQIKSEREEQSRLRDKRELLKQKQDKLQTLFSEDKCREEVRSEIVEKYREKAKSSGRVDDIDEHLKKERVQARISREVENELSGPDIDELVEDVQRLQAEVADLSGGREDYFLDLDSKSSVEVSQS